MTVIYLVGSRVSSVSAVGCCVLVSVDAMLSSAPRWGFRLLCILRRRCDCIILPCGRPRLSGRIIWQPSLDRSPVVAVAKKKKWFGGFVWAFAMAMYASISTITNGPQHPHHLLHYDSSAVHHCLIHNTQTRNTGVNTVRSLTKVKDPALSLQETDHPQLLLVLWSFWGLLSKL